MQILSQSYSDPSFSRLSRPFEPKKPSSVQLEPMQADVFFGASKVQKALKFVYEGGGGDKPPKKPTEIPKGHTVAEDSTGSGTTVLRGSAAREAAAAHARARKKLPQGVKSKKSLEQLVRSALKNPHKASYKSDSGRSKLEARAVKHLKEFQLLWPDEQAAQEEAQQVINGAMQGSYGEGLNQFATQAANNLQLLQSGIRPQTSFEPVLPPTAANSREFRENYGSVTGFAPTPEQYPFESRPWTPVSPEGDLNYRQTGEIATGTNGVRRRIYSSIPSPENLYVRRIASDGSVERDPDYPNFAVMEPYIPSAGSSQKRKK